MNPTTYPQTPGYKEKLSTSQEAAESVQPRVARLRELVLTQLRNQPQTADEVAASLNENILSIRPRLSELRNMAKIEPSGKRRKNQSGCTAAEWRVVTVQQQPDLF